jgi:hypothetical protein
VLFFGASGKRSDSSLIAFGAIVALVRFKTGMHATPWGSVLEGVTYYVIMMI